MLSTLSCKKKYSLLEIIFLNRKYGFDKSELSKNWNDEKTAHCIISNSFNHKVNQVQQILTRIH